MSAAFSVALSFDGITVKLTTIPSLDHSFSIPASTCPDNLVSISCFTSEKLTFRSFFKQPTQKRNGYKTPSQCFLTN